jgi:hypothetical protein
MVFITSPPARAPRELTVSSSDMHASGVSACSVGNRVTAVFIFQSNVYPCEVLAFPIQITTSPCRTGGH